VPFTAHTNTILQVSSAAGMRGRVMALWAMAFIGSTVLGAPIIGWVGQQVGPRWALGVGAAASLLAGVIGVVSSRAHADYAAELPAAVLAQEETA
jgi:MFS family permease